MLSIKHGLHHIKSSFFTGAMSIIWREKNDTFRFCLFTSSKTVCQIFVISKIKNAIFFSKDAN
jgi:hypothetical protein